MAFEYLSATVVLQGGLAGVAKGAVECGRLKGSEHLFVLELRVISSQHLNEAGTTMEEEFPFYQTEPATKRILDEALLFLRARGLDVSGIALAGSRARHSQHSESDYDLLVLSRTPRNLHIEDITIGTEKIQFFVLPLGVVDHSLLFNAIIGDGILASMFEELQVYSGAGLFDQIRDTLRANRQTHMVVERETANRNLLRLRYRASKLLRELSHSTNSHEDRYTAAELLKVAGHILLAKKGLSFRPTGKHLHGALARAYSEMDARALTEVYGRAVAQGLYTDFLDYCTGIVLDGATLNRLSTGESSYELRQELGYNVIFLNAYSPKLVRLVYEHTKDHRPILVLNQHRDLMEVGVYFIVDGPDMGAVTRAIEAAELKADELNRITINYQLDKLLLGHFTQYNHGGLMADLSAYSMDCDLDRDVVMNSVFDWILNAGIATFNRDEFAHYSETCRDLYVSSMAQQPDKLSLDQLSMQARRLEMRLEQMNITSVAATYQEAISAWVCMDVTDSSWRRRILEVLRQPVPFIVHHAMFKQETKFSAFHAVFEMVFNASLLRYSDRGLLYCVLHRCLEEGHAVDPSQAE